jgi:hypothetical protein
VAILEKRPGFRCAQSGLEALGSAAIFEVSAFEVVIGFKQYDNY